jgi:hypothetical protein
MEGIWTGLGNFLRPFRGVHKKYLTAYVAMFEWVHNLKGVVAGFQFHLFADMSELRTVTISGSPYGLGAPSKEPVGNHGLFALLAYHLWVAKAGIPSLWRAYGFFLTRGK